MTRTPLPCSTLRKAWKPQGSFLWRTRYEKHLASVRRKDVLPWCRNTHAICCLDRLCCSNIADTASVMLYLANLLQALVLANGLRSSHCQRAYLGEYSPRVTLRHPTGDWGSVAYILRIAAYGTGQPVGLTREQRWRTRGGTCVPLLCPIIHG